MTDPRNDGSAFPLVLAALAIFVLTVMDALIKRLTVDWGTLDIVVVRYMVGAVCCIPLVAVLRPPQPSGEMLRANAIRAVVVLATGMLFFYALAKLPLVEAVVFSYLAPLFLALLGRMMLGEAVSPATGIAIALGFAGVVVIAFGKGLGAGGFGTDILGIAAALGAALTYALAMVLLRARTASDDITMLVAVQNGCAALMILPFGLALGRPLQLLAAEWPSAVAIGMMGTLGHFLLAHAYKRATAARIGAVEYTGFVWALPIGLIGFGEWPTVHALAGAALIIGGAMMLLRRPKAA